MNFKKIFKFIVLVSNIKSLNCKRSIKNFETHGIDVCFCIKNAFTYVLQYFFCNRIFECYKCNTDNWNKRNNCYKRKEFDASFLLFYFFWKWFVKFDIFFCENFVFWNCKIIWLFWICTLLKKKNNFFFICWYVNFIKNFWIEFFFAISFFE